MNIKKMIVVFCLGLSFIKSESIRAMEIRIETSSSRLLKEGQSPEYRIPTSDEYISELDRFATQIDRLNNSNEKTVQMLTLRVLMLMLAAFVLVDYVT